jgi:PleD family two-component response regulator
MNVLVINADETENQEIDAALKTLGHTVFCTASQEQAEAILDDNTIAVVLYDPAPLTSARQPVMALKRHIKDYTYFIQLSDQSSQQDAIKSGMNDVLVRPITQDGLKDKIENAIQLSQLIKRLSDDREDFPSAGGIISKSAFYQLFYSGIDRADRYGESSYVIFISIINYQELLEMDGSYAADYAAAKLSQFLNKMRRQSDIIGQTAKSEYALLLQRPAYEEEPIKAAERYTKQLGEFDDLYEGASAHIKTRVQLVKLPVGQHVIDNEISKS